LLALCFGQAGGSGFLLALQFEGARSHLLLRQANFRTQLLLEFRRNSQQAVAEL
jgi:hypothetical protein